MIEGLKPYQEYKESRLPWAPQVPAHWNLVPNRANLKKRKILVGANHGKYRLLSLTKRGVIVRDVSTGKGKFSSDMGTSQEVRKGDFVFCLFDVPETPRTVGLSPHDGMITSAYTVFESQKMTPEGSRFLECFYLAMDDQKLLSPLYSGLRHTISPTRFLGTKTPLPPPDEQSAIVRFLDHANKKIDGFMRAKRKLIGLLNEQKQAIIHRAVTRGLDPSVPLKPSGIPWLGDIPKHWAVRKIKHAARLKSGEGITALQIEDNGPFPVFGGGGHRGYTKSYTHDGDYVLIGRQGALCGNIKYARGKFFATEHAVVATPLIKFSMFWFGELLRIMNLNQYSQSAAQPGLSVEKINNLWIPFPSIAEQEQIVQSFEAETKGLDTAIARTEREITLMQEYRARLTADVVTGKLDVRPVASHFPQSSRSEGDIVPCEETEEDLLEA